MIETESPFIRKLRHGAALSDEDVSTLNGLAHPVHRLGARQDLIAEGGQPHSLPLILDGWACRYRDLPDGRRQIIAIFLPGDLCEPFGTMPLVMDHAIASLTPITYARVPARAAREAARASQSIEQALWWDALICSSVAHERCVSLGQRTAFERLAHLYCELQMRLEMVGLAGNEGFDLPLTQQSLGHALGMSSVHLNRSLQALRQTGLVITKGRHLLIADLDSLRDVAAFDPGFLHLCGTRP